MQAVSIGYDGVLQFCTALRHAMFSDVLLKFDGKFICVGRQIYQATALCACETLVPMTHPVATQERSWRYILS